MAQFNCYLAFDGNCKEAMEFYKSCFGGELSIMKVSDSPMKEQMPKEAQDKVVHSELKGKDVHFFAADWMMPMPMPKGSNISLSLMTKTLAELKTLFDKLSDGANITNPLKEEFFGTYGTLIDKFGIRWMFQTDAKA